MTTPLSPHEKILVIQRSIQCFFLGWLGLIPLAGPLFGGLALIRYLGLEKKIRRGWNPARHLAICGMIVAIFGTLISAGLWIRIVDAML
jgi:hypothetical protein